MTQPDIIADITDKQDLPLVLVADDSSANLMLMNVLLEETYRVRLANDGEMALEMAAQLPQPDLILLDVVMPGMDGYEACRRLKASPLTREIPVIFLTARREIEDEQRCLDLGAVDFVTKPISPPIVLARIRNHLKLKIANDFLRHQAAFLQAEVLRHTNDIRSVQDMTLRGLANLAGARSPQMAARLARIRQYTALLAGAAREDSELAPDLSHEAIDLIAKSAPLLDIGTVGMPDDLMDRIETLTGEEAEYAKSHAKLGLAAIRAAESRLSGEAKEFLRYAAEITYTHHERWDGVGYPRNLKGEEIPLAGRLVAVVDTYETMTRGKAGAADGTKVKTHAQAVTAIIKGRESRFDPRIVDVFNQTADVFQLIGERVGRTAQSW